MRKYEGAQGGLYNEKCPSLFPAPGSLREETPRSQVTTRRDKATPYFCPAQGRGAPGAVLKKFRPRAPGPKR
jgi:hypothetical protein